MCRVASLLCRDLNLVEGEKIKWLGEEKENKVMVLSSSPPGTHEE